MEERLEKIEEDLKALQQSLSKKRLDQAATLAKAATMNVTALHEEVERNRTREHELATKIAAVERATTTLTVAHQQMQDRLTVLEVQVAKL